MIMTSESVSDLIRRAADKLTQLQDQRKVLLTALMQISADDPVGNCCNSQCTCSGCTARAAIRKAGVA